MAIVMVGPGEWEAIGPEGRVEYFPTQAGAQTWLETVSGGRGPVIPEPVVGVPITFDGMGMPGGVVATPAALPLAAIAALRLILRAAPRFVSIAFLRSLWTRFGPVALKAALGVAVFTQLVELMSGGAPDETLIRLKRKKRRLSIGANPRLNTLLKVGKYVDNIFARYDSRIKKFRSRLRGGTRRPPIPYWQRAGMGYYLSGAERKQLRGGR